MSIVKELQNQYFEIENLYASKEFVAHSKGRIRKEEYWRRKRELNTHAYFLFLFTRLEDHIKTQSSELIIEKRANIIHWKTKAIWENTDAKKLHFKKKVGLLTEKGQADYNKILDYYKSRNTIAHGDSIPNITVAINMINVFDDMKEFFKNLKK